MGYTHFNQVCGVAGVYKGAKGSEIDVSVGNQTYVVNLAGASTAIEAAYIVVPYNVTLVAAYADISSGTTGTGAAISIFQNDTAGTALFGAASIASAGTAGQTTTTFGTMSTAAITALSSIAVVKASCATAFGATVTIVATKAS